jgi:hypothetical protein
MNLHFWKEQDKCVVLLGAQFNCFVREQATQSQIHKVCKISGSNCTSVSVW